MRKIFSILVTLMMVAGTFVSCNMPTNTDIGSSTGTETTTPSATLKEFIKETFTDFNKSTGGKVYSAKIKGTDDYVLIPAKAAVPDSFSKKNDNIYSLGNAELIKDSTEGMNIYFYHNGDSFFYFKGANTITMDSTMNEKYFDYDEVTDQIVICGKTFNIVY